MAAIGLTLSLGSAAFIGVAPPAGAVSGRYQIRPGDTLSQLAIDHGVSVSDIARANGIANPDHIYAGTSLAEPDRAPERPVSGTGATSTPRRAVPAGTVTYTVQPGDTLIGIASRFETTPSALVAANGLRNRDFVRSGTTLRISQRDSGTPAPGPSSAAGSARPASRSGSGRLPLDANMNRWAARYGVPADLLKATTYLESGWQREVVSSTGAIGIGQLMPDTVRLMQQRIGVALDPWNADDNTRMTACYLRLLLDQTGGDVSRTLAAYYQGLGALRSHGMYDGTLNYVNNVLAVRARYR